MNLKLVHPTMEMEQSYFEYIDEWQKEGNDIHPHSINPLGRDYKTWLQETQVIQKQETCPPHLVTADTYFLINDAGRMLGAINIRHSLNDYLLNFGGHIGYGVRPSERRKGYATLILKLALEKCRELGLEKVRIICNKENHASSRTIIANGGVLENEVPDGDRMMQRYWINLE